MYKKLKECLFEVLQILFNSFCSWINDIMSNKKKENFHHSTKFSYEIFNSLVMVCKALVNDCYDYSYKHVMGLFKVIQVLVTLSALKVAESNLKVGIRLNIVQFIGYF